MEISKPISENDASGFFRHQLPQVVALTAPCVQTGQPGVAGIAGHHSFADGLGNRPVVTGVEETLSSRHHLLAITRVQRTLLLYRQQMQVALAGDIETVASRALPASTRIAERVTIQRAGEGVERVRAHGQETSGVTIRLENQRANAQNNDAAIRQGTPP